MKAWVFCMLTIHVIAMGPLPLKRPRSINSQSTMDSGDHLWQYLESLEPAGREFSLGQLSWVISLLLKIKEIDIGTVS